MRYSEWGGISRFRTNKIRNNHRPLALARNDNFHNHKNIDRNPLALPLPFDVRNLYM